MKYLHQDPQYPVQAAEVVAPSLAEEPPAAATRTSRGTNHQVISIESLKLGHIIVKSDGVRARIDEVFQKGDDFRVRVTGEQGQTGMVKKEFTVEVPPTAPPARTNIEAPDMTAVNLSKGGGTGPSMS